MTPPLKVLVEGLQRLQPAVDPTLTTGLAAPFELLLVWLLLPGVRGHILQDNEAPA